MKEFDPFGWLENFFPAHFFAPDNPDRHYCYSHYFFWFIELAYTDIIL